MPESRHSAQSGWLRLPRLKGATVPAALVGVSVLLVLIVVAVSSVMGNGRADVIPLGGSSAPSVDQGQVLDGHTQAGSGGQPNSSPSGQSSKSAKPTPVASRPTAGAPVGAPFQPVSVEAETGARRGNSNITSCATCSAGAKVGHIGNGPANYVTLAVSVPSAADYLLTVTYELDTSQRSLVIAVNGATRATMQINGGAGWTTPATRGTTIPLVAGTNLIKFFNDAVGSYAPDLDKITVSS
jgi:hypothetical protein